MCDWTFLRLFSYHISCFWIIKFVEALNKTIWKICLFVFILFYLAINVIKSERDVAYALI